MIGVIYTGEKKSTIVQELGLLGCLNNSSALGCSKTLLFVEPELERKFIKEFDVTGVCTGGLIQRGYISQFQGYEVTNSTDEYKKRNTKTITKKEIAEKFGVDIEFLNIVD